MLCISGPVATLCRLLRSLPAVALPRAVQQSPRLPAFSLCTVLGSRGLALCPFWVWLFQKGEGPCHALEYDPDRNPDSSGPSHLGFLIFKRRECTRPGVLTEGHLHLLEVLSQISDWVWLQVMERGPGVRGCK